MKKLFITIFTVTLLLVGISNAKAMSESELLKKFTASYNINGYQYQLSEGDKVLVKRYLDSYDVSSKDADYISSKIDQAISAMRNSGLTDFSSFSKFPSSLKRILKGYVEDIASNTSIKASLSKGTVIIYAPDGTVFAEISKIIKNTGSSLNVIVSAAILITIVGAIVLVKNVKTNA